MGLGCRSGGYLVYLVIATGLLIIELLIWWLTHQTNHTSDDLIAKFGLTLERHLFRCQPSSTEKKTKWQQGQQTFLSWFTSRTFRDVMRNFVLRPFEVVNTAWLVYIVMAQSVLPAHINPSSSKITNALTKPNRTFGAYQTCDCMASVWAKKGGFIDFQTYSYYGASGVYYYWGAATGLSLFVMSTGLVYIVEQYCTQSHISTEDYHRAMQGLRFTRWYKKHTRFVSFVPGLLIRGGKIVFYKLSGGRSRRGRRSLVWTAETRLYRLGNLGYRMNP